MSDGNLPDSTPEINPAWRTATNVFAGDELMAPSPRLSILLATVTTRAALFAKLHAEVLRQTEGRNVEVLIACDNKEISIGKKRQNLLLQAKGDFICYIDDDDFIAPTYVDDILAALETSPDCVGFKIHCTTNGMNPESAIASIRYPVWREKFDGYDHCRSIYHKTPVRRSLALKVGFPDLRYAEDKVYSSGIMKLVKTESFVDKVLYYYRFKSEPFATKYGIVTPPRKRGRASSRVEISRKPAFNKYGRKIT